MNPFEMETEEGKTIPHQGGSATQQLQNVHGEVNPSDDNGGGDDDDDDEAEPLVVSSEGSFEDSPRERPRKYPSTGGSGLSSLSGFLSQRSLVFVILLFLGGLGLVFVSLPGSTADPENSGGSAENVGKGGRGGGGGTALYVDPDRPVPGMDDATIAKIRSVKSLRKNFQAAKDAFIQELKRDYGEHYSSIFNQGGIPMGRLAFRSASLMDDAVVPESFANSTSAGRRLDMGVSWERLKRKMVMKLLEAQLLAARNKKRKKSPGAEAPVPMPRFVWATGGHSAAAAHGDLVNESYTAVLERAVQPVLSELGVWFQGRNYAMGATASAPEVSLCHLPIFGNDIDMVSWDFGMTDGNNIGYMELYFRQASMSPSRPACLAMVIGGGAEKQREGVLRHLEDSGVAAFYLADNLEKAIYGAFPDSFGLNETEYNALAPFVKNFKCEGLVEKSEPCTTEKFTPLPGCEPRYRVHWHPGWYVVLIKGERTSTGGISSRVNGFRLPLAYAILFGWFDQAVAWPNGAYHGVVVARGCGRCDW
jgi:hypothetical protein